MEKNKTVFVAGGTGFIGQSVLKALKEEHPEWKVKAVARSPEGQALVASLGAMAVPGDLLTRGVWQKDLREADASIFVAQPRMEGKLSPTRIQQSMADLKTMTENFFQSLDISEGKRIVFCSGHSYFGRTGKVKRDEGMTPNPVGFGPYIVKAVEGLKVYEKRGFDLAVVYPGPVYGNGSWVKEITLDPLIAGKKPMKIGRPEVMVSPVHVADTGRAIAHLLSTPKADLSRVGRHILLIDDQPVASWEIPAQIAKAMGKVPRFSSVPRFLFRLFAGKIFYRYMTSDFGAPLKTHDLFGLDLFPSIRGSEGP